ncbi:MAG: hypothetical protein R2785_12470 [Flavobacteriaceae bacterium]
MKYFSILLLLFFNITLFAQEEQHLEVFKSDSTWIKEIIQFPIGFAQDIKYEGYEDLRFPKGWSKQESQNFWSYVWAWNINNIEDVTTNDLEKNIQYYFDGLLGLDFYKIDDKPLRKTNAVFIKKNESEFIGKVKTHDTRYTKKPMTLYVIVKTYHCKEESKTIIHFKFSPKPYEDEVWETLNEVKLKNDFCKT